MISLIRPSFPLFIIVTERFGDFNRLGDWIQCQEAGAAAIEFFLPVAYALLPVPAGWLE
jgi:hypothetical protein